MSATKLLVLGVVHLSGGAHGYQVRYELQSWGVESWAKIKPGSIYHALKKAAARLAMLASRTNTMLSVPMLYCMVMQKMG